MAHDLPSILRQLFWLSDFSSSMVLAEARVGLAGHPLITVSGTGQSSLATAGFEVVTAAVPGHRYLWLAAPYALTMAGVLLLTYVSWRLAGAWAALMTMAIAICAAPALLEVVAGQNDHGVTLFNVELLATMLVLAYSGRRPRAPIWAVGAVLVGVPSGIDLASDQLLLVTGLLPFVIAPIVSTLLRRRRRDALIAAWSMTIAVIAFGASLAFDRWMHHAGFIVPTGASVQLAAIDRVWSNLGILVPQLLELGNGGFIGRPFSVEIVPVLALAVVTVVAVVAVVLRPAWMARAATRGSSPGDDAEFVYASFWAISVGVLLLGFTLSTIPVNSSAVRYLGVVFVAAAACVPLWARFGRYRPVGLVLGGCLFCAASAWSVHWHADHEAFRPRHTLALPEVVALLDRQGLHRGYSTYWDANAVTYQTGGRIRIAATSENPTSIAPFQPNSIDTWYQGSAPGPTFILIDPQEEFMGEIPGNRVGRPDRTYSVGRFTVLVYSTDVAAQFAH